MEIKIKKRGLSSAKSVAAFKQSAQTLAEGHKSLYMWTITSKKTLEPKQFTKLMHTVFDKLKRQYPDVPFLRVWEWHPGTTINGEEMSHGLHCHLISTRFMHVLQVRTMIQTIKTKLGTNLLQCNVVKVPAKKGINYLSKYLVKGEKPECLKNMRMWGAINFDGKSKVSDMERKSFRSWVIRGLIQSPVLFNAKIQAAVGYDASLLYDDNFSKILFVNQNYYTLLFSELANSCPYTVFVS